MGVYVCPQRDNFSGIPLIAKKVAALLKNQLMNKRKYDSTYEGSHSEMLVAVMKTNELNKEQSFPFKVCSIGLISVLY